MRRLGLALLLGALALPGLGLSAQPARAEAVAVSPSILALTDALQIGETVMVLRDEGLASAESLAADLPGGPRDPNWTGKINRIYDLEAMQKAFNEGMATELAADPEVVAAALAFFGSDLGQRALRLEIDARRALADPAVEAKAKLAYDDLDKVNPGRRTLIDRFVVVGDLVESNVMGTLNSNLAFFRGMATAGGETFGMTEADMLDEVWRGEAEAREQTVDWLFPFLTLAYQPLTDAELQAYVDFSDTAAGRRVNAAMFAAFDSMFDRISEDLGRAVALQMQGQDI